MIEQLERLSAAFETSRVLCYHPESDSMFEAPEYLGWDNLVEDVTGVEWAEKRWRELGQ